MMPTPEKLAECLWFFLFVYFIVWLSSPNGPTRLHTPPALQNLSSH